MTMNAQIILVSMSLILSSVPFCIAQQADPIEQQTAVTLYPDLAKSGSLMNKNFLAAVQEAKNNNDPVLQRSDWPVVIAKKVAADLADALAHKAEITGKVIQVCSDGLIIDAQFLQGFDVPEGAEVFRDLNGEIDPQKSNGLIPKYREEVIFLSGHPYQNKLVDESEIDVIAEPIGIYQYVNTEGAQRTVHQWNVLQSLSRQ